MLIFLAGCAQGFVQTDGLISTSCVISASYLRTGRKQFGPKNSHDQFCVQTSTFLLFNLKLFEVNVFNEIVLQNAM
jgi:hypothetical protein